MEMKNERRVSGCGFCPCSNCRDAEEGPDNEIHVNMMVVREWVRGCELDTRLKRYGTVLHTILPTVSIIIAFINITLVQNSTVR